MKEVSISPTINSAIVNSNRTPFAKEFRTLAEDMSLSLRESLDNGDIDDIEAAGRQALAAMLTLYADGTLPPKQSFSFLKSLAERKTPDPVQKIEQHNVTDMRVLVQDLIKDNPAALENTLSKAEIVRTAIKERLQLTAGSFDLTKPSATNHASSLAGAGIVPIPNSDSPENPLRPNTPDEIENISAGRSPQEGIDGFKRFSTGGRHNG